MEGDLRLAQYDDAKAFFRVEQMKFSGKRPNLDRTKVHYNANITIADIPLEGTVRLTRLARQRAEY
jgi:predicted helicase